MIIRKMTSNRQIGISRSVLTHVFTIDQTYKRIFQIAEDFNAAIPKRKGFGYLDSSKEKALWCITLNDDSVWHDSLSEDGYILSVKKTSINDAKAFQKMVRNDEEKFDVKVKRLTFVRTDKQGEYRCLGVYVLSAIDFDRQTIIFRRIAGNRITLTRERTQVAMNIESVEENLSF